MLIIIFRLLAKLPLRLLHALGGIVGVLIAVSSPTYRRRLAENIANSGIPKTQEEKNTLIKNNILENGRAITELPAIWFTRSTHRDDLVLSVDGLDLVLAAQQTGRGLILLSPHLGCFEIIPHHIANMMPFTALYRPPKIKCLAPLMKLGRERHNINLVPTNTSGVRSLFKALKRGEAIGILPDQVPASGDGEWAEFFGRPAYTMNLWSRLAEKTNATILFAHAKREASGKGFRLYYTTLPTKRPQEGAASQLNRGLEQLITENPTQFLWAYNRYKNPTQEPIPVSNSQLSI